MEGGAGVDFGSLLPIARTVLSTAASFFGFLIIPIWAFYILRDRVRLTDQFQGSLPESWRDEVWSVLSIIERVFGRWIRAQLLLGVIVGLMTYAGLVLLGLFVDERFLQFAILLAVIAGFLELLPIIGPIISMIPTLLIALITDDPVVAAVAVVDPLPRGAAGREQRARADHPGRRGRAPSVAGHLRADHRWLDRRPARRDPGHPDHRRRDAGLPLPVQPTGRGRGAALGTDGQLALPLDPAPSPGEVTPDSPVEDVTDTEHGSRRSSAHITDGRRQDVHASAPDGPDLGFGWRTALFAPASVESDLWLAWRTSPGTEAMGDGQAMGAWAGRRSVDSPGGGRYYRRSLSAAITSGSLPADNHVRLSVPASRPATAVSAVVICRRRRR